MTLQGKARLGGACVYPSLMDTWTGSQVRHDKITWNTFDPQAKAVTGFKLVYTYPC